MAPRKQTLPSPPAPVEPTTPAIESVHPSLDEQLLPAGIQINPEYNTSVPNWVMDAKWWKPVNGGRKPSVDCVLIYIWCTDKVTDVIEYKDVKYGRVLSGKAVSLATIAANLGISWSSAQINMQHLVDVGLIHRTRGSAMKEYSYSVLNCRKKFNAKQPDGSAVLKVKRYTRIPPAQPPATPKPPETFNIEKDDELTTE